MRGSAKVTREREFKPGNSMSPKKGKGKKSKASKSADDSDSEMGDLLTLARNRAVAKEKNDQATLEFQQRSLEHQVKREEREAKFAEAEHTWKKQEMEWKLQDRARLEKAERRARRKALIQEAKVIINDLDEPDEAKEAAKTQLTQLRTEDFADRD
jgi:hypothetical protein